jgi:membrane protease YdiL (CAAX protease family)
LKRASALPNHLNVPWSFIEALALVLVLMGVRAGIIVVLMQLAAQWQSVAYLVGLLNQGNLIASLLLDAVSLAAAAVAMMAYLARYHVSVQEMGWRKVPWNQSVLYVVAGFVVFSVSSSLVLHGLGALLPQFHPNQIAQDFFVGIAPTNRVVGLVTLVIIPPLFEETVFRGFLFPAIAKRWGVVWGAVLSSAVFGIAHFQLNLGIYTFLMGLVLCWMYTKLRSIVPGMWLHMINNLVAFILLVK